MELAASDSSYPGNWQIPIDLFVSKKHPGITRGDLAFADSSGNIVYKISRQTPKSSPEDKKVLLDATGNPLLSIHRYAVSLSFPMFMCLFPEKIYSGKLPPFFAFENSVIFCVVWFFRKLICRISTIAKGQKLREFCMCPVRVH